MATEELLRPTVRLDVFDGPLDLLLYLVHSHELDPRTIPVSQIADQYIAFLDSAREDDLAIAGEYLVMAAKLLSLKARELLPREQQGELEPEEFDGFDREELVKQLLEYRRFKQAAEGLRGLETRVWGTYPRGMTDAQGEKPKTDDDDTLEAGLMGLFDLLKAFRSVLSVRPRTTVHEIEIDDIPLEERMNRIRAHLVREGKAHFDELYPHDGRRLLPVVTFMAIMELTKNEELAFRQAGTFQPMVVYRKSDERFADELAHMDQVYTPDPVVNPDVLGLLAEKERLRIEALAREEATWGGNGIDPETGEPLPGFAEDLLAPDAAGEAAGSDAGGIVVGAPVEPTPEVPPAESTEDVASPDARTDVSDSVVLPDESSPPSDAMVPVDADQACDAFSEQEPPEFDDVVSCDVSGTDSPEPSVDVAAPDSVPRAGDVAEDVEALPDIAVGEFPGGSADVEAPAPAPEAVEASISVAETETVIDSPAEPEEVDVAEAPPAADPPARPAPQPSSGLGSGDAAATGGSWLAEALAAARAQLGQGGRN